MHRLEEGDRPYLITKFLSVVYSNIMLLGKKMKFVTE